ncbi:MAG: hypothetical protein IMF11_03410 [Proteobacteria bacterium]|nr:hypothetical protein [Pseudomonadota bacterium]
MENQLLKFGKCIIDRETKFIGADIYRITDENGNTIGSAKKGVIRDLNDKAVGKIKKKGLALSPTWTIHDSSGKPVGAMKKKRTALKLTYVVESPSGDLITSIKGEDNGYQFYAPDEKTLLASFVWETAEREEAKKGGLRGFIKKAAEAAKAALKGKRVLQLHSEQLRPLLALSSAIQLMEIEREEERKREGGEYEGGGDDGD